jgi:hypothetical protein
MLENFNRLTKEKSIIKGWQCSSFMLNGGAMVKT